MTEVLMAEPADGYRVVFALAEMDPALLRRSRQLRAVGARDSGGQRRGPFHGCRSIVRQWRAICRSSWVVTI